MTERETENQPLTDRGTDASPGEEERLPGEGIALAGQSESAGAGGQVGTTVRVADPTGQNVGTTIREPDPAVEEVGTTVRDISQSVEQSGTTVRDSASD